MTEQEFVEKLSEAGLKKDSVDSIVETLKIMQQKDPCVTYENSLQSVINSHEKNKNIPDDLIMLD